MKLKIGNTVYLQGYEISYMLHGLNEFPWNMLHEMLNNGSFLAQRPSDFFDFKYAFSNPENVQWIMDRDWIFDYEEYKRLSTYELEAIIDHLSAKLSNKINAFSAKGSNYKTKYGKEKGAEFTKHRHEINSLQYLLSSMKGEIAFITPK